MDEAISVRVCVVTDINFINRIMIVMNRRIYLQIEKYFNILAIFAIYQMKLNHLPFIAFLEDPITPF